MFIYNFFLFQPKMHATSFFYNFIFILGGSQIFGFGKQGKMIFPF